MTRRLRFFALALLASVALGASACADATAPNLCEDTGGAGSGTYCNGTGGAGSGT